MNSSVGKRSSIRRLIIRMDLIRGIAQQPLSSFLKEKTWKDYVNENRMEITCGKAPYLVSRYDTVTGEPIPVGERIGLLDRKLWVVETSGEWLEAAQKAYKSKYGYEWQGDNIVLARENLLYTFVDYYKAKFGKDLVLRSLLYIAYIISWNIRQMDGLKGVIPNSCKEQTIQEGGLFDEPTTRTIQCSGCREKSYSKSYFDLIKSKYSSLNLI